MSPRRLRMCTVTVLWPSVLQPYRKLSFLLKLIHSFVTLLLSDFETIPFFFSHRDGPARHQPRGEEVRRDWLRPRLPPLAANRPRRRPRRRPLRADQGKLLLGDLNVPALNKLTVPSVRSR